MTWLPGRHELGPARVCGCRTTSPAAVQRGWILGKQRDQRKATVQCPIRERGRRDISLPRVGHRETYMKEYFLSTMPLTYMFLSFSKLKEILKTVRPFISEHKYLMSQWSLGRAAFAARADADAPGRENTKPLQKLSET